MPLNRTPGPLDDKIIMMGVNAALHFLVGLLFRVPPGWHALSCNAFVLAVYLAYLMIFQVLYSFRLLQPKLLSSKHQMAEWHGSTISDLSAVVLLCGAHHSQT
jgi:hypothetical protein